jgi:hypothetical protein
MKERMITLGCALGALLLFITLFVHVGGAAQPEASLPTTEERGANGLLGARRWLAAERIPTRAVRQRFEAVLDPAASGNLLIVSLPVATPFKAAELTALDNWLRAGNTLLVLAALADRPDWAADRTRFAGDLIDLTGLSYYPTRARLPASAPPGKAAEESAEPAAMMAEPQRPLEQPERSTLIPNRAHAWLDGVREAVAWSDYRWRTAPWQAWTVSLPRFGFALCLAHQRETGEGVLWVRPHGSGTVIVSGFASLFANRALGSADNARLLANIVGGSVRHGGAVLFDDEHQGLSETYDARRFYGDPRLYATIGVLAALWLTWVLGGTRLAVPVMRTPAPREAQLVRATGVFLARVLTGSAAARRMFEHFFRRLRERGPRADSPGPPWALLEHHPRVARADLAQLREWYAAAHSSGRVPLRRLHNLMIRIERQLAA